MNNKEQKVETSTLAAIAGNTVAPVNFHTVGTLKKALEGLPDDRYIVCQVVAKDGKVWNMWGEFCPQVPQGTIACLTFRHDELETLP
jgi:hypothetical protein